MLTPQTFRTTLPIGLTTASNYQRSPDLSRMFAAAVVSQQFCDMLLQDPHEALRKGYLGEVFSLSREERDLIVSIRANSLSDLAKQVNRALGIQY